MLKRIAVSAALTLAIAGRAEAAFLANGDFETGDLSFWTYTGATTIGRDTAYGSTSVFPTGHFVAVFNGANQPASGVLSQAVATTAGKTYAVSFDFGNFSTIATAEQSIKIEAVDNRSGTTLLTQTVIDATPTTNLAAALSSYTFQYQATGVQTLIRFTDTTRSSVGTDGLVDNVANTATPEPGMLTAVMMAIVGMSRRRTRTPAYDPGE